ncbi:MAG: hypothetical protein HC887_02875 [Desulfobacteraceae bacterium]|nr:hypothetical protein [Desulfobacteraceae bacterium]
MELNDGGEIRVSSFGAGNGGNISVSASDSVTISGYKTPYTSTNDRSGIYAQAKSSGDVGDIKNLITDTYSQKRRCDRFRKLRTGKNCGYFNRCRKIGNIRRWW